MGALSFWYFWPIGIRKKWINFIFKKRKNFWGGSNWPIFSFTFWGVPTLSSIFSVISWSILKILVPILVQISWILWNTPSFLNFDVFEWSYGRKKENLQFRKWANLSHPWKSSFFKIWNLSTFFLFLWIKSTKMKVRPYFAMQKVQKQHKTP